MLPGDSNERIMVLETSDLQTRRSTSLGRQSSTSSSLRRRSFSLSGRLRTHLDEDEESESVSQAGDIGDRALNSNRNSECGSCRFSMDFATESGVVVRIPEDFTTVAPQLSEIVSPLPTDGMLPSDGKKQEDMKRLPSWLEYVSCMIHLSVFGILGIGSFLKGWFGVVFKPDIASVSDQLAIGLSTGYFGSLTTFSGWNQKMLDLSVKGH